MKIFQFLLAGLVCLSTLAFVSHSVSVPEVKNDSPYLIKVKQQIQTQYAANFKKSKVRMLNKQEVQLWVNEATEEKAPKLRMKIQETISALLNQEILHAYLIEQILTEDNIFNAVLVAHVGPLNYDNFNFSDYMVSNAKDDDEEDADVCTFIYGYELDLTGTESPEDVNDRCPCMGESREEGDCGDGGACADPC